MRYNQRVRLIREEKKLYDSKLGRMVSDRKVIADLPCFTSPVRVELLNALGGKLNQSSLVIHTRGYKGKVDSVEIDGRPFTIVQEPVQRNGRTIFYVNEVLDGNARN